MPVAAPSDPISTVWRLLEAIPDPEIPVLSIRELGILRDVRLTAQGVIEAVITPTYSGCPAIGQIEDDITRLLATQGISARVVTQLAPAWTTDWMDATAHAKLRDYGIAPPRGLAASDLAYFSGSLKIKPAQNVIQFAPKKVAAPVLFMESNGINCPQCNSLNTTETSHFASTACKALYKCLDCLEPFDYFKPY